MKFPRNARILRGQLDFAPFASVFFLVIIFVSLGSLVYTPGVRVELPQADDLPGTDRPTIAVAVDPNGRFYFENQSVSRRELETRLRSAVADAGVPLTLVVQADKAVTDENLIDLALLARKAGIYDLLLATLPRVFTNGASAPPPPHP
jgi:biopolymer transport protein ExbD